jgi:hypothetical protein
MRIWFTTNRSWLNVGTSTSDDSRRRRTSD